MEDFLDLLEKAFSVQGSRTDESILSQKDMLSLQCGVEANKKL